MDNPNPANRALKQFIDAFVGQKILQHNDHPGLISDLHIFLDGFFALNREFLMLTAVTKNMPVVLRHFSTAQKPQAFYIISAAVTTTRLGPDRGSVQRRSDMHTAVADFVTNVFHFFPDVIIFNHLQRYRVQNIVFLKKMFLHCRADISRDGAEPYLELLYF